MSTKYTDAEIRRMIRDYLFQEMMLHPDPIAHPYEYEQCRSWADEVVENGHYSVIERYGPESPGWSGDVLTFIMGHVEAVNNCRIEHGRLVRIESVYEKISYL